MEKPAEGEWDALNTQEAAVVATGLAKEQESKKAYLMEHTWAAHFHVSPGD